MGTKEPASTVLTKAEEALIVAISLIGHALKIEHFTFEKGETRGGSTAPPGQK